MTSPAAVRRVLVVLVAVGLGVVSCAAPGTRLETVDAVTVWPVESALRAPVWSYGSGRLLGMTGDGRVAAVDGLESAGRDTHTAFSGPLVDVGRNLVVSPLDDTVVFVPQPAAGHVACVRIGDLAATGTLDAGPAPDLLALNSGSRTLLSIDADATTVTPVDLHRDRMLPATRVDARPGAHVQGAARGRQLDFHVADASGITHYRGVDPPAEQVGRLDENVTAVAGDGAKVSRLYVGQAGTGRLVAVDSDTDARGLRVVGTAELGEDVRFVTTDDTRVYAVTDRRVVVFTAHSFDGFSGGEIPEIREFDYRTDLPDSVRDASVSGVAAGPDRIYLTLQGASWVVGVAKPMV